MSDPVVTVPANPYASVMVDPTGQGLPVAHVFVANVQPVGDGDLDCTVDANVTRGAVQRTIDMLTAMLPDLPVG